MNVVQVTAFRPYWVGALVCIYLRTAVKCMWKHFNRCCFFYSGHRLKLRPWHWLKWIPSCKNELKKMKKSTESWKSLFRNFRGIGSRSLFTRNCSLLLFVAREFMRSPNVLRHSCWKRRLSCVFEFPLSGLGERPSVAKTLHKNFSGLSPCTIGYLRYQSCWW